MRNANAAPKAPGESILRRGLGLVGWAVVGSFVLVGTFISIVRFFRRAPFDQVAERICASEYDQARTKTDSLMIDSHRPITGRLTATTAVSCGEMRSSGRFRSDADAHAPTRRAP